MVIPQKNYKIMKAFLFPGQGSQKESMGKDLYDNFPKAKEVFEQANDILGERFSDFLFTASEEVLMDTRNTQMGVFLYEVAIACAQDEIKPDCVAGHSLGEYAALVVSGALGFEETVNFIKKRGEVFYNAFIEHPSAMGAIIGLSEVDVRNVLSTVSAEENENLYVANYNGPGQLVITGGRNAIKKACRIFKDMGAKRALLLPQKGVGHSPNSINEGIILEKELRKLTWKNPQIPIYMDFDGKPHVDVTDILETEVKLMTNPVQWTHLINEMDANGVDEFYECGTDDTLQKIVKRMLPEKLVDSIINIQTYKGIVNDYSIK